MLQAAGIKVQTLVDFLQDYMDTHNLDQNSFGRKANISSAMMSHIMTGRTKRPGLDLLEKIANATGKSKLQLIAMIDHRIYKELDELLRGLTRQFPDTDPEIVEIAARLKRINQIEPGVAEDLLRLIEAKK